jgi:methionyl-tRNA synthetase
VEETARKKSVQPQDLCDDVADEFRQMCSRFFISYDDYVRTTEQRHRKVVQEILMQLYGAGEIYKASYSGMYSTRAERFVQEKDKVDGRWPEDIGEPLQLEETNYFFRLSKYQSWLLDYLQTHPQFIFPSYRQKQVMKFLKEPINDLCISRPKARLSWGIELPFDTDYVTYVWFDALINYISAIGYGTKNFGNYWPADLQVIGKDILVPAHAIYWPIMLHAIGIEPPRRLIAHGWWLARGGEKMSKSLGNTIQPLDYGEIYGADAFRFFVLREMATGQDSNFSHQSFLARYNGDLANGLGNLLSRFMHMVERYCGSVIPQIALAEEEDMIIEKSAEEMIRVVRQCYGNFEFHTALAKIFAFVAHLNGYVEMRAPWKLSKESDKNAQRRLRNTLATLGEGMRVAAELLRPVMPHVCEKIFRSIGYCPSATWHELRWDHFAAEKTIGPREILFPKIEEKGEE